MASTALVVSKSSLRPARMAASADAFAELASPARALIDLPVRLMARSMILLVATLVFASIGILAVFPVDLVVSAPGRVVSLEPAVVVQPLETSIVRAINVKEGQVVKAGDVLARLDSTFTGADTDALKTQVASFQAEVDRLTAESKEQPYEQANTSLAGAVQLAIHTARLSQYRFQIVSFDQKISGLQSLVERGASDVKAYRQRLSIAADLEGKRRELERRQVGSVVNRMAAEDQRIEIERNLASAISSAQKAARDLSQMTADRDAFRQQWKEQIGQDLNQRQRSLSDASENLRKATLRHELVVLRAERDSVVLNVAKVSVGSVVQSGDQLMTLIPEKGRLDLEARMNAADAGLVHEGRKVVIKFDAFPYARFGVAEGTVQNVSADSFTSVADEMQHGAGVRQSQQTAPYYRVRIAVDELKMHDVPGGFNLVAGMPAVTDIKLGQRTVLAYILDRVVPIGLEGMREP